MASCEADSQIKDCPQEVLVADEVPGPSAPCMDTSSQPQSSACSRKRPWSTAFSNSGSDSEMEVTPEMQGTWPRGCRETWPRSPGQRQRQSTEPMKSWAVEWLLELKTRLKKQRVSTVLPEHHKVFNRLLEDPVVKRFLAWDKQLRVSDKYLLAMVVAYLSRAGLCSWKYRRIHFFMALGLAAALFSKLTTRWRQPLYMEKAEQRPGPRSKVPQWLLLPCPASPVCGLLPLIMPPPWEPSPGASLPEPRAPLSVTYCASPNQGPLAPTA